MANILIVEDEKNMQEIIAEYMRRGGHTCFTADDGVDALMILKNNPMDLMILDIMMPHLDGFSVCKMAREMSFSRCYIWRSTQVGCSVKIRYMKQFTIETEQVL